MKFTEERLKLYAAPLSETENEKCKRAIKAIRDALYRLKTYQQGAHSMTCGVIREKQL